MSKRKYDPLQRGPYKTPSEVASDQMDKETDRMLGRMAVNDPRRKKRPKGQRRSWKTPLKEDEGRNILDWGSGKLRKIPKRKNRRRRGILEKPHPKAGMTTLIRKGDKG